MTKIPQIERLTLPKGYPTPEAIKSWGQNEHFYHPDMWDLEYVSYRYLSGMTGDALRDRYRAIIRNMRSYTGPERDVIPIKSYQSSWYWFRKEHQTRLEFAFREIEPLALTHQPLVPNMPRPAHSKVPNGTDVIFRYGKREYMQQMVQNGRVRFSPAESYEGEENNVARRDDELQKHAYMPGRYTTIMHESGQRMSVSGDVQRTISGPRYHLMCFSCIWDAQLFEDFDADTCVAVTEPQEFARRITEAGQPVFPGWYFLDCPVQYFDPYERMKNEFFDAAMSKEFRYAYQNEFRILWSQMRAAPIDGFQFVDIGPAHDIMTMYDMHGSEIIL